MGPLPTELPSRRLVGRRRARRSDLGVVVVRGAVRPRGDCRLCGRAQPSGVGRLVVAGT